MYTLRRISGNGIEMNHSLGDGYTVVNDDVEKEFNKCVKTVFGDTGTEEPVHAFVSGNHGEVIYPLYKNQRAYIMCSDGKTLDNLTWK